MEPLVHNFAYAIPIALVVIVCSAVPGLAFSSISHTLVNHPVNEFNVAGGYVAVQEELGSHRIIPPSWTCLEYARSIREPYSAAYWKRSNLDELNVTLPLSYWNWDGNITAQDFEKAATHSHGMRYKVVGGKLYRYTPKPLPVANQGGRRETTESLLKFTLYLFPIPDMEFLVSYGDGDGGGRPFVTFTQSRHKRNTGFAMPSGGVWMHSLGPTQMTAYHACLRERYPANKRKPMAVWRGSNTGPVFPQDLEHCLKAVRVRMHMLSREYPDLLDASITSLVQRCGELIAPYVNDTAPRMQLEDENQYCVILDADGNGWSDRFANALVHFPTVIMKEATNYTAYVEHLFPPGHAIEQFDSGLTTLIDKLKRIIQDCKRGEHSDGQKMVHRMQTTARLLLDHTGIARSMAYTLLTYKRLSAFELNTSLEGYERVGAPCCGSHVFLPPEVVQDINRELAL